MNDANSNPETACAIGVDVGGTKIAAGIVDPQGRVLEKKLIPTLPNRGGETALRTRPMTEGFLTPISPLQFPADGLAVLREFIRAGQPVCIASMPMASGTAPVTLAGAMALANAKNLDLQAGIEKGATLALGALAGADLFGHAGIRGADHGASLLWLCADNELMSYVKRMARGLEVRPDTLATDIIHAVKPGGNFLAEEHTVKHLRQELWLPGAPWTRQAFGAWESEGRLAMADRLQTEMQRLLKSHQPAPPAPDLSRALDEIVNRAREAFAR